MVAFWPMFSCCIWSESCVSPLGCDTASSSLVVVLAPPLEEGDVIFDADGPSTTDPPEGCTEAVLSSRSFAAFVVVSV